jgi:hypothetical protein
VAWRNPRPVGVLPGVLYNQRRADLVINVCVCGRCKSARNTFRRCSYMTLVVVLAAWPC